MQTRAAEMRRGLIVEREHSNDLAVRAAIACDHLQELPDYYTRLDRMERSALGAAPTFAFSPVIDEERSRVTLLAVAAGGAAVLAAYLIWSK